MPIGDYPVGFGRPPADHQFKKGNPGGPGRPKGSLSQDTIMRRELNRKMPVTIKGKRKEVPQRELAFLLYVSRAFETKDPKLLAHISAMGQQLFPETSYNEAETSPLGDDSLDEQILRDLYASLSMGEPASDTACADESGAPLPVDADTSGTDEAWNEGDWTTPGDSWEDGEDERDEQE